MGKHTFIQGALILFVSNIFVKIIGFIYQVLIIRLAGTEAVGLFNMIFPLYITILVLTSAGLPIAISKIVAYHIGQNNYKKALKTFKITLVLLTTFSVTIFILIILFSSKILNLFYADNRVLWCFYAMSPGIIIVSLSSAFRGFFQGLQDMVPPAISQCIEQIVRFVVGIYLIYKLQAYGIKMIALGLSVSMICGEIISLLLMLVFFKFKLKKLLPNLNTSSLNSNSGKRSIIKELFGFGLPITMTRLVSSIVLTVEASLIPLILQKSGFSLSQAASSYGQFSGVAITLLTIPTVLTFSLATSLIPSISEAEAQGALPMLRARSTEALRLTYVFGLPAAIVLFLKATEISTIFFNLPENGTTLKILSFGAIFLYLIQTSNGILQGLGLVKSVFINTTIGAIIKIIGIIFLVSIPELNINGAALAFTFSFIIVSSLNLLTVHKNTNFYFKTSQILIPFCLALVMGAMIIWQCNILSPYLSEKAFTLWSILSSGLLYVLLSTLFGQLNLKSLIKNKD
ncbi:stage V sporulation protein B [Desulfonispora thiosulfatigenes DSM 11270]|uniref:Stage V sporulation protein B n=1 Tax=Desulfonispora thiosulfatigenes DSM 11270 TaxID=656914 RepID=A0A1W1VN37_DESTI|nr:stage V sporulation protein B [Desulfonispora thiosulfatigenes]SMB94640.1 stage V sporulation protein B [Desulfonispora thiosulfatigenes DSM 11270]